MDTQSTIDNIRVKTALLESLNWDEELMESLFEYLDASFVNLTPIDVIIENVSMYYTSQAAIFLESLFEDAAIKNDELNPGFL